MEKIITINPATEEILGEYIEFNDSEINNKIELSQIAFNSWSKEKIETRCNYLQKVADELERDKQRLGTLITKEMGKPISEAIAEIEKCVWICRYYAEKAPEQLANIPIQTGYAKSYVAFIPLGPILAIMPWNFPFWQVFRFAIPNIAAGNTAILKHSRNTMGCAIEIENIFRRSGLPEGVVVNLVIGSNRVAKVIEDPRIKAVTLTGSTPVGREVAKISGFNLKKNVLELGGSDPYIILRDAPLEKTVKTCVQARLINNGQSCIAAKRFIVEKSIMSDFIDLFINEMKSKTMGNPLDLNTDIGPLARRDLRLDLHSQVSRSLSGGAKLQLGGTIPDGTGYFYPATVITDVNPNMAVFNEETFGPVAAIIKAEDEGNAIELANQSAFGLGAALFTADIEKGNYIAKHQLQAGCCFVNDFVKSDPRLPFGGVKDSGYGRELSVFGIREFVNIKTVCVK